MHALLTPCCVGLLLSCVDCCEPQASHLFVNLLLGHCQGEVFFEDFFRESVAKGSCGKRPLLGQGDSAHNNWISQET